MRIITTVNKPKQNKKDGTNVARFREIITTYRNNTLESKPEGENYAQIE
jgi:hypothetical protein